MNRAGIEKEKRSSELGSLSFFFLLLSGLLLFFFTLLADLSVDQLSRQHEQQVLDQAAILASKKLPDVELAKQAAKAYVSRYLSSKTLVEYEVTAKGLSLSISKDSASFLPLSSAYLFSSKSRKPESRNGGGVQSGGAVSVASAAALNPKDIAIVLDTSSYLAPDLFSLNSTASREKLDAVAWREQGTGNKTLWPEAKYFRNLSISDPDFKQGQIHPLLATQQCFNPALLALKKATQRLYEFYSANPMHQVAVFAGPREEVAGQELLQIRPLSADQSDRGNFGYYRPSGGRVSDEMCYRAARTALRFGVARALQLQGVQREARYAFRPRGISFQAENLQSQIPPALADSSSGKILDVESLASMRVQDVIWSRAAQRQKLNVRSTLLRVGKELLLADPREDLRASYSREVSSSALFLLGDFPHQNGQRFRNQQGNLARQALALSFSELQREAERSGKYLNLFFAVFPHFGNYGRECLNDQDWYFQFEQGVGALYCERFFQDEAPAFQKFIQAQDKRFPNLQIRFFRIATWRTLGQEFVNAFSRMDSNATLLH